MLCVRANRPSSAGTLGAQGTARRTRYFRNSNQSDSPRVLTKASVVCARLPPAPAPASRHASGGAARRARARRARGRRRKPSHRPSARTVSRAVTGRRRLRHPAATYAADASTQRIGRGEPSFLSGWGYLARSWHGPPARPGQAPAVHDHVTPARRVGRRRGSLDCM